MKKKLMNQLEVGVSNESAQKNGPMFGLFKGIFILL